jgi:hypothetical protein
MLRKITIALAAAGLLGAAAIPSDALAFGRGFGGHGGFGGGGFSRGFGGHGFVGRGFGPGFRRFGPGIGLGLGLGLGYGAYYYGNRCYAWTPYGYQWICGGYPYPYY